MSRFCFSASKCLSVLLVALLAAPPAEGQRQRLGRAPSPTIRLASLGLCLPEELAIDAVGTVRVACTPGTIVSIDVLGRHQIREINWLTKAAALSTDGAVAGGQTPGNAIYNGIGVWVSTHPVVRLGSFPDHSAISEVFGIENTPSGIVAVGRWGYWASDIRPGSGRQDLFGPGMHQMSEAHGVSAVGDTYCGFAYYWDFFGTWLNYRAVRWVDRVPEFLDDPNDHSFAYGLSPDGSHFAGQASDGAILAPAVWLASEGSLVHILRDHDGAPFEGKALGVLDSGFAFGNGARDGDGFGWIWHPGLGSSSVLRIDTWLALSGLPALHVESVQDVVRAGNRYHFLLWGGTAHESWYVRTP